MSAPARNCPDCALADSPPDERPFVKAAACGDCYAADFAHTTWRPMVAGPRNLREVLHLPRLRPKEDKATGLVRRERL